MRRLNHITALALAASGCAMEMPPAAAPAQDVPVVPLPNEVAPGRGIVIVDTPDGPSSVSKITGVGFGVAADGTTVAVDTERNVCPTTPCATDMRKGAQTLVLRSADGRNEDTVAVTVGDRPVVVRHRYDQLHRSGAYIGGFIVGTGGLAIALTGLLMYGIGHADASDLAHDSVGTPSHGVEDAGVALAVGGAVTLAVGGLMMFLARGTHRAGATTIFTPSPAPEPPTNTSPSVPLPQ